jgi:lysophospholipase L1-like esterase
MNTPNPVAIPTIKNPWLDRHTQLCEMTKSESFSILFLGDSITEAWATHGSATWDKFYAKRKAINFGINGERVQNLIWRVLNGALDNLSPSLVVILIGTNNIDRNPVPHIAEAIQVLLQHIVERLPNARILLLGVFPREKDPEASKRKLVRDLNAMMASTIFPENIHYLDIGSAFLDQDGNLPVDLFPDGLHPCAKAYAIWADRIEPTIQTLLAEAATTVVN